jgi:hypothetical protein
MPAVALVQVKRTSNSITGTTGDPLELWLPNPSLAGNGLVLGIQSDALASGYTISDDKTNTWSAGPSILAGQRQQLFFLLNATTGTRHISIAFTGTNAPGFVSAFVAEFCGLASSGSSTNAAGASAQAAGSVAAGSFTPASTGDLIIQWAQDETAAPSNGITGFTKGTGFTKLAFDRQDGSIAQYRTAPGGAINPTLAVTGTTDQFQTVAMSLPANSANGTTKPTSMVVVGVHDFSFAPTNSSTSLVVDVPCVGNLTVVSTIMFSSTGNAPVIGSETDSRSATYTERGSNVQGVALDPVQIFDAVSTANEDTAITLHLNFAQNGGSSCVVWDIANAPSAPYDTFADLTGNQTSAGNLAMGSLAPTTNLGILVGVVSINSHTVSGIVAPPLYASVSMPNEDGGSNPLHQDNGWAHVYNSDTSAQSFTWTIQHNTAGVGTWGGKIVAYKGAPDVPWPPDGSPAGPPLRTITSPLRW